MQGLLLIQHKASKLRGLLRRHPFDNLILLKASMIEVDALLRHFDGRVQLCRPAFLHDLRMVKKIRHALTAS